jgi:hypothetical protein
MQLGLAVWMDGWIHIFSGGWSGLPEREINFIISVKGQTFLVRSIL